MNAKLKEYRAVLGAAAFALISIGACAGFVWITASERAEAIELLKQRSQEINRFRGATPPPSKDHSKQLKQQLDETESAYEVLREAIASRDKIRVKPISPQEFQQSLNKKAQTLLKKAETESVALPPSETEGSNDSFFYLSFKEFKTKTPSPEKAPELNRQLLATELLVNLLLDNHPLAIRKIRLVEPELPEVQTPVKPSGKGAKAEAKAPPKGPAFNIQGFDLHFSAKPNSLREFLNALAAEKQAFFVPRNLKVTNSKEKEPPKKAEQNPAPSSLSASVATDAGENAARFVLGDEYVEVELSLDLLSLPPEPERHEKEAQKR